MTTAPRTDLPRTHIGDDRLRLSVSRLCLGAMNFGTRVDEATAFAILDRFRDAGGDFVDTSDNYNQWLGHGGDSEELLGRWLKSRRAYDEVTVATKVGGRSTVPGDPSREHYEGLSAAAIRSAAEGSLARLGVDRLDLHYAHLDDRAVDQAETVAAFAELARSGRIGVVGASNHATWRLARARDIAAAHDWPRYTVAQQVHTYMTPRPGSGALHAVGDELLDYAAAHPDLTIACYSPLFAGYYARRGTARTTGDGYVENWRKLEMPDTEWDHSGTHRRLEVLDEVVAETGATPNQVVLSWLLGSQPAFLPVFSASSVEQLDEILGALDVELSPDHRRRLDAAC